MTIMKTSFLIKHKKFDEIKIILNIQPDILDFKTSPEIVTMFKEKFNIKVKIIIKQKNNQQFIIFYEKEEQLGNLLKQGK